MPFKQINPIYPIVRPSYPDIGKLLSRTDPTPQIVDYSQNALAADWALQDGVKTSDQRSAADRTARS